MNYQLLSIDLDDTLLNDQNLLTENTQKALKYAMSKGVKVVMCSGRSSHSVSKYLCHFADYKSSDDFFISYNGAIVSTVGGDIIFKKILTGTILQGLIDIGRNESVDIQLYSDEQLIVESYTDRIRDYELHTGTKSTLLRDLKACESSIKLLYNSLDIEKLERMKRHIELTYSDEVNVFFSKKHYLEVLMREANKGLALEYLANYLKIDKQNVIAIGDSENDAYMIRYAGLGICMKNGRESVKAVSNYITEKTNNEEGVAEVIYKFIQ